MPKAKRVRDPLDHVNSGWGNDSTQATLDLREDRLLLASGSDGYMIFPLEEVRHLEWSDFGTRRFGGDSAYSTFIFGYAAKFERLLFPVHRKPDVPLSGTKSDEGDAPSEGTYWRNARYAVQIDGQQTVWLYHAYKDTLF